MSAEESTPPFKFGRATKDVKAPEFKIKSDVSAAPSLTSRRRGSKGVSQKNQPMMRKLVEIVGSSGAHDVTRVRGTESLGGATKYLAKKGLDKVGYTAIAQDIDGDNIHDVIIKDVEGNYVIVNGYSVRNSDLPYRQLYYDEDEDVRKKYSGNGGYRQYIKSRYYNPAYDTVTGEITGFDRNPDTDDLTRKMIQHNMRVIQPKSQTPYQLFTSRFVPSLLKYLCTRFVYMTAEQNEEGDFVDGKLPNVTIAFAAALWNRLVVDQVLRTMYPSMTAGERENLIFHDKKTLARISKSKVFKDCLEELLNDLIPIFLEQNEDFIYACRNILDPIVEEWSAKHPDKQFYTTVGNDTGAIEDMTPYVPAETKFKVPKPER